MHLPNKIHAIAHILVCNSSVYRHETTLHIERAVHSDMLLWLYNNNHIYGGAGTPGGTKYISESEEEKMKKTSLYI